MGVSFDIHVSDTFDQKPTLTGPSVAVRSGGVKGRHDSPRSRFATRACVQRRAVTSSTLLGQRLDGGWTSSVRYVSQLLTFVRSAQQTCRHAPVARRPDRLRRGLQPRAVAACRLGRRHAPDARVRCQLRDARGVLVVLARAQPRASTTFEWLDEIMDLLHANGIAVDLATATATPPPWLSRGLPRDPARRPRRPHPLARQPAGLVPVVTPLPRAGPRPHRPPGHALPRPPGPGDVARLQRVRLPQPALLLRHLRHRASAVGSSGGTAPSTRSTRPGAPPSGASATRPGTTSSRRGAPRRSATRRTRSTTTGSARTPCSTSTAPSTR